MSSHPFHLRIAVPSDIPALEDLITASASALQPQWYSAAQVAAALGPVFGVDRHLIADGTYFIVEQGSTIVGCGGWSRRSAVFGGDRARPGEDRYLDPTHEPARIRAFFVHPAWARRGIGRLLLVACEEALTTAGFTHVVMVATLAGEPLYAAHGYMVEERYEVLLSSQILLPVVRMSKTL